MKKIHKFLLIATALFPITSAQATFTLTRAADKVTGDPYPYTQTINDGGNSFDVQMSASLTSGPTQLYVSTYSGLGIQQTVGDLGVDHRHIGNSEVLEMTFSNITNNGTVELSELIGGNSNYFQPGRTIDLFKNGVLVHTIQCNGGSNYSISPAITANEGDVISLNPNGNIRLASLKGSMLVGLPDSYEPYVADESAQVVLQEYTVTEPGHYYLSADWTSLTHKPDGVAIVVGTSEASLVRMLGEVSEESFGQNLGVSLLDKDLLILNPGDTVKVVAGLTEEPGENSNDWINGLTLARYDSWSGSRYTPAVVPLALASPTSGLWIHDDLWPKNTLFRGDSIAEWGQWPRFWNSVRGSLGHAPKCFSEEWVRSTYNLQFMDKLGSDHPNYQVMLHWNARYVKLGQAPLPSGIEQLKPYHFLYKVGSTSSASIGQSDTTIQVNDPSAFEVGNYAIVLAVDPVTNERDFESHEMVGITAINGNTLTVERNLFSNLFGTTGGSFSAGAHIAPGYGTWDSQEPSTTKFNYNYSVQCPRDSLGRNAGDILVETLSSSFAAGDQLQRFHGLMFDILDRGPLPTADTNLDGFADGGIGDRGIDLTHLGVQAFARKIRAALPGRIITFDGFGKGNPYLHDVLNGIENEGFSRHNDSYNKDWGSSLNVWQYTNQWNTSAIPYNFCILKYNDLSDGSQFRKLQSMNNAAGTILDITMIHYGVRDPEKTTNVDDIQAADEFRKGADGVVQWLGSPMSGVIRPALATPDLLSGAGLPFSGWNSSDNTATISNDSGGILVSATSHNDGSNVELSFESPDFVIPEGDLVIRFEAKGEKFTHFPSNVGRYISATLNGRESNSLTSNEQQGICNSSGWTEIVFYWRGAGAAGGSTVNLNLSVEGSGDLQLRNITVHNATDVLAREYENGVVLTNPNPEAYEFDLAGLFPGVSLSRITGQSYDDPITNSGSRVGDTVTIPAYSGLFLQKNISRWEFTQENDQLLDTVGKNDLSNAQTVSFDMITGADFSGSVYSQLTTPYNAAIEPGAVAAAGKTWQLTLTGVQVDSTWGAQAIFSSRDANGQGTIVYVYAGKFQFWTGNGSGGWNKIGSVSINTNATYKLVAKWDGTTMSLIVDDGTTVTENTSIPSSVGFNTGTYGLDSEIRFGVGGNSGTEFTFNGRIATAEIKY